MNGYRAEGVSACVDRVECVNVEIALFRLAFVRLLVHVTVCTYHVRQS